MTENRTDKSSEARDSVPSLHCRYKNRTTTVDTILNGIFESFDANGIQMKFVLTSHIFLWSVSLALVSAIENGTEVRMLEDNCTLASKERNTMDISYYCGNASGLLSVVNKCPASKEEWNITSSEVDCQNETTYHCLIDNVGKLRHGCLFINWYKAGHCPYYSSQTEEILWIKCGVCPVYNYPFYTIYKYQECVTPIEVPSTEESSMVTAVIIIVVFILVIIGIMIVGVQRRQIRESVFVASFADRIHRARQRRMEAKAIREHTSGKSHGDEI